MPSKLFPHRPSPLTFGKKELWAHEFLKYQVPVKAALVLTDKIENWLWESLVGKKVTEPSLAVSIVS